MEWGSFTTSLSAPSTIVVINPPGATTAVTAQATGGEESPGADAATEDVSATSIDTSAL